MPKLSEIARVTGGPKDKSLDERVQLVYMRLRSAAEKEGAPYNRDGAPGYVLRTTVKRYISSIFPESELLDAAARETFAAQIYAGLRASGNAVCVEVAQRGAPSLWWVSKEYRDATLVPVPVRVGQISNREKEKRRLEAKVTPQEAGEDREPAPVKVATLPPPPVPDDKPKRKVAAVTDPGAVVRAVNSFAEPSVAPEIAAVAGVDVSTLRSLLPRMVERGMLFARIETPEERAARAKGVRSGSRPAKLYSTTNPVPKRTLPEFVPGTAPTNGAGKIVEAGFIYRANLARKQADLDNLLLAWVRRQGGRVVDAQAVARAFTAAEPDAPFKGENAIVGAMKRLASAGKIAIDNTGRANVYTLLEESTVPTNTAPTVVTSEMSGLERATFRALENTTVPLTAQDIAAITGFSDSATSAALRKYDSLVERVGLRQRCTLFQLKDNGERSREARRQTTATPPTPTAKEATVPTLAPTLETVIDQATASIRAALVQVAQAAASTSPDAVALRAENDQLQAKLSALRSALL